MEYIIEKSGRKRQAEKHKCKGCGTEFLRRMVVAKGREKAECCSVKCRAKFSERKTEVRCSQCGNVFYKTTSKMNANKHGHHFCSRDCKDLAQSLDGKCLDIRPSHYGDGYYVYADRAFRNLPNKCCQCSEDKEYLLVVHHIDGNRKNSELGNLEMVCYNCHAKRHLKNVNGRWTFNANELTDRKMLLLV